MPTPKHRAQPDPAAASSSDEGGNYTDFDADSEGEPEVPAATAAAAVEPRPAPHSGGAAVEEVVDGDDDDAAAGKPSASSTMFSGLSSGLWNLGSRTVKMVGGVANLATSVVTVAASSIEHMSRNTTVATGSSIARDSVEALREVLAVNLAQWLLSHANCEILLGVMQAAKDGYDSPYRRRGRSSELDAAIKEVMADIAKAPAVLMRLLGSDHWSKTRSTDSAPLNWVLMRELLTVFRTYLDEQLVRGEHGERGLIYGLCEALYEDRFSPVTDFQLVFARLKLSYEQRVTRQSQSVSATVESAPATVQQPEFNLVAERTLLARELYTWMLNPANERVLLTALAVTSGEYRGGATTTQGRAPELSQTLHECSRPRDTLSPLLAITRLWSAQSSWNGGGDLHAASLNNRLMRHVVNSFTQDLMLQLREGQLPQARRSPVARIVLNVALQQRVSVLSEANAIFLSSRLSEVTAANLEAKRAEVANAWQQPELERVATASWFGGRR